MGLLEQQRFGIRVFAVTAALAGALLHALKGAVLLLAARDLSLVPAMLMLFALGLVGFGVLLGQRGGVARQVGMAASSAAVIAGFIALAYQWAGFAPEQPHAPAGVGVSYALGTIAIFIGLIALGIAVFRYSALPGVWRAVPLTVGILWFPLEGLTAVLPDGWGLLLAGLSWTPVAYCIWLLRPRNEVLKN